MAPSIDLRPALDTLQLVNRTGRSFLLAGSLLSSPLAGAQEYDHRRLLYRLAEDGTEHAVETAADWRLRRAAILVGMEAAMGELPPRKELPAFDLRVIERVQTERYLRQTVTFTVEEGDRVPAYLYLPVPGEAKAEARRRPAVLALHPTSPLGKGVVDGQSGRPNRAYGKELAERGYVVLAPDYPPFGDYKGYDFEKDRYASATMKGIFNHMRCVDLLESLDEVDGARIGVIGHSLGGHNAIFVGAFDERLKVIVTSCGWTPFHDYYGGKLAGWAQDKYMPRLRTRYDLDPDKVPFDFHEAVAALAPRSFFTNSPVSDHNFAVAGVKKAMREVRRVYQLHEAGAALVARYPEAGHDFPPETRKEAYEFIDRVLGRP